MALVIGLSMIAGVPGQYGRGKANDRGDTDSAAVSEARAVIHSRIELGRDGTITSDIIQGSDWVQINEQQCDIEAGWQEPACRLLIYEMQ
ncbi:hypothetical protein C8024_12715 [Sphingopyxis sp. BSNA05]|uniref:hypothetical protein n=2 Tax=Sphingomonadaceae TaxID=41297 RepID=UPI000C1F3092|nr:hypothetical protein [Sphingorhabdus sp. YGSMI21]ATW04300.1 hypothetical protein CHN51_12705 [Sphingorhabdus sp. YGSMI21]NRD90140.1 hypothetical protein [Sphingopyxis sp. BSNA05]